MKARFLAIAAACLALTAVPDARAGADAWAGQWLGDGVDSRKAAFPIAVFVYDDGSAKISYPYGEGASCGGPLLLIAKTVRGARHFREKISDGAERCIDGADLTLTVSKDGIMRYRWTGQDNGEVVTATGALKRPAPTS